MMETRTVGAQGACLLPALALLLVSGASFGCSGSSGPVDSGAADSGAVDSRAADTGGPAHCGALFARFDSAFATEAAAVPTPGGAVAAVHTRDCGIWTGAAGEALAGTVLAPDALMRIGSVSKTYTAAAVLKLVTAGTVALDDVLNTYVTGVPNGDVITIRQLLNHTSGTFDLPSDRAFMMRARAMPTRTYTPQELIDVVITHPASFAPGTSWGYSNTNYILLGMIIESASGQTAAEFIRSSLLAPSSLASTFMEASEMLPTPLAPGFTPSGTDAASVTVHPSIRWTAGAMVATATDAATWAARLYGGHVLAPAEHTALLTGVPTATPSVQYGLGVVLRDIAGVGPVVGHGGAVNPAYHTTIQYVPATDVAVAVVTNRATPMNREYIAIATALLLAAAP